MKKKIVAIIIISIITISLLILYIKPDIVIIDDIKKTYQNIKNLSISDFIKYESDKDSYDLELIDCHLEDIDFSKTYEINKDLKGISGKIRNLSNDGFNKNIYLYIFASKSPAVDPYSDAFLLTKLDILLSELDEGLPSYQVINLADSAFNYYYFSKCDYNMSGEENTKYYVRFILSEDNNGFTPINDSNQDNNDIILENTINISGCGKKRCYIEIDTNNINHITDTLVILFNDKITKNEHANDSITNKEELIEYINNVRDTLIGYKDDVITQNKIYLNTVYAPLLPNGTYYIRVQLSPLKKNVNSGPYSIRFFYDNPNNFNEYPKNFCEWGNSDAIDAKNTKGSFPLRSDGSNSVFLGNSKSKPGKIIETYADGIEANSENIAWYKIKIP